jgi:Uma2 family endonuclease
MRVNEQDFLKLVMNDPKGQWELHCGELVQKPDMTLEHNWATRQLGFILHEQLDRAEYDVVPNMGHVHHSPDHYYIPDLYVVPMAYIRRLHRQPRALEMYGDPLPLVVEVWSPTTGRYDVQTKLHEYQRRGDLEIWYIHPYDRTLRAWSRQPDGTYAETLHTDGMVRPASLPGVAIDLDQLFI